MSHVVCIVVSNLQIKDSKVNRGKVICPKVKQMSPTVLYLFHHMMPPPKV